MEWEQKRWTVEAGNFLSAIGFLQALETELRWIFAAGREKVSSSLQTFLNHVVFAVEKTPVVWPPVTSM